MWPLEYFQVFWVIDGHGSSPRAVDFGLTHQTRRVDLSEAVAIIEPCFYAQKNSLKNCKRSLNATVFWVILSLQLERRRKITEDLNRLYESKIPLAIASENSFRGLSASATSMLNPGRSHRTGAHTMHIANNHDNISAKRCLKHYPIFRSAEKLQIKAKLTRRSY